MTAEKYLKEHGINQASIEKFGLSWNKEKITIPVIDEEGDTLFNKYRHLNFDPKNSATSKYSYDKGGKVTLFNILALKNNDYIFLTEGEIDCIRLDQEGISAITCTSGAGTFKDEWIPLLEGKRVYVLYDSDTAGQEGAAKVLTKLPHAVNILLPTETKDVCEFFTLYGKVGFLELIEKQKEKGKISYEQLCDVFDKWLLLPDKNMVKVLLATLIAHHFESDPLWMFFVAPPSGSKTEIISTIASLPFCHMLSDLTANTLASGMPIKKNHDPSLLSKLKNHVLIMKDFTTVLNMRYEDKAMILSQLREIYDGRYSKTFGTGKTVSWEGRLTFIAGVTSIIDTHYSVFQTMGERFMMYRVPQADNKKVATKALVTYGKEKQMREELRDAMTSFFNSIKVPDITTIELPEDILDALASLASFIVTSRSQMVRDPYKKELIYIPEPEAPGRFAKQLGSLIKGMTVLEGRTKVTWNDYYLTLRIALDAIPANRTAHLLAFCGAGKLSTTEVAQKTKYSRTGTETILEDLTALEIIDVIRSGTHSPNIWGFSNKTKQFLNEMLPKEEKDLYTIFPANSHYSPLIAQMLSKEQPILSQSEMTYLDAADEL